ncbi:hypothetical protein [Mesorhizobium sp. LjRoot246]|uniref:hypothetical protein n=1 Tax=Mesorhizobium sp. LjRoot246 TaxID=3342294 RepID=UPI003ECEC50F
MILLSCTTGEAAVCKPLELVPARYASLDQCRASLADRLASAPNGEIVGRCQAIDTAATASLPADYTTVVVTRGIGAVTSYVVPRDAK